MSEPTHPDQSAAADRRSRRRELLIWIAVLAALAAGVAVCLVLDHRVVLRIGALLLSTVVGGMIVGPITYLRGVCDERPTDRTAVDGTAMLEAVRRIRADDHDAGAP